MSSYVRCAVRSCSNNAKKTGNRIKYFRFPRDEELLTLWTVRCDRRDSWNPSTSFVCSSHFNQDDYVSVAPGVSRLHDEAVPSRNMGFDWDEGDQRNVLQISDDGFSDDDDSSNEKDNPIIRSLLATNSRSKANKNINNTYGSGHAFNFNRSTALSQSDTDFGNTSSDQALPKKSIVANAKNIKRTKNPTGAIAKKKQKDKNEFCVVPTCSASASKAFHNFPKNHDLRIVWTRAIFHEDLKISSTRRICRRHFTVDDYLKAPGPGKPPRLKYGTVPSKNLPICRAEVLLARKQLYLNVNRRKPEERNLPFPVRLPREPELIALHKQYVEEVQKIDPARAEVLPTIPKRGELVGAGEPMPSDVHPQPDQDTVKKWLHALKDKIRIEKLRLEKDNLSEKQLLKKELRINDPGAYQKLLLEERTLRRKKFLTKKLMQQAEGEVDKPVQFSQKFQIIAQDPEKGKKYQIVVKKVLKKQENPEHTVSKLAKTGMEIVNNVIKDIDFSKTSRIKFPRANKLTKTAPNQKGEEASGPLTESGEVSFIEDSGISDPLGPVVELEVNNEENQQIVDGDERGNDVNYDNEPLSDGDHYDDEMNEDVIMGGSDHCYTSKKTDLTSQESTKDPFDELQEQLRSMSENDARELVRQKMDFYKATFVKQMTRIRQLVQFKKKVDRKVRTLTRVLSSSLREQYVRYYHS